MRFVTRAEIKLEDSAASPPGARRITVILNAAAGPGSEDRVARVTAAFAAAGHAARVVPVQSHEDVSAAVEEACRARPDVIAAGGGDGTINTVAQGALAAGIPLGVLPLGTLNHFAKDLGIPLDLDDAVRCICAGRLTTVDVGEVQADGASITFLNNSSLGVYPRMVRHRDGQMRRNGRSKWLALAIAGLTVLRVMPLFTFRVRVDGGAEEIRRSSLLMVGNNDYVMEGMHFGERRSLTDGRLSLYVPRRRGHAGLLALAVRALAGGLSQDAGFEMRRAREIVVDSPQSHFQVAIDGEVKTLPAPLTYRIRPRALQVVVP